MDNSKIITKEMVKNGFENEIVKVIYADGECGCDGIVCKIGDYAFYFADIDDTEITLYEYFKTHTKEEIIEQIYSYLNEEMKTEFSDEYEYYYYILIEQGEKV